MLRPAHLGVIDGNLDIWARMSFTRSDMPCAACTAVVGTDGRVATLLLDFLRIVADKVLSFGSGLELEFEAIALWAINTILWFHNKFVFWFLRISFIEDEKECSKMLNLKEK